MKRKKNSLKFASFLLAVAPLVIEGNLKATFGEPKLPKSVTRSPIENGHENHHVG